MVRRKKEKPREQSFRQNFSKAKRFVRSIAKEGGVGSFRYGPLFSLSQRVISFWSIKIRRGITCQLSEPGENNPHRYLLKASPETDAARLQILMTYYDSTGQWADKYLQKTKMQEIAIVNSIVGLLDGLDFEDLARRPNRFISEQQKRTLEKRGLLPKDMKGHITADTMPNLDRDKTFEGAAALEDMYDEWYGGSEKGSMEKNG